MVAVSVRLALWRSPTAIVLALPVVLLALNQLDGSSSDNPTESKNVRKTVTLQDDSRA
jgi:hypothetical protein